MKIHLLRSPEYNKNGYAELVSFLTSFPGPVQFIPSESIETDEDIVSETEVKIRMEKNAPEWTKNKILDNTLSIAGEGDVASWNELFGYGQQYRTRMEIPADDWVLLLTTFANQNNWFSALDPAYPKNGFIHTGEWEQFVKCSPVFPASYLVASIVLQGLMFTDMKDLMQSVHKEPTGCFNDFCGQKKEILLKLRTADICYDCMNKLKGKADEAMVQQVLDIFEAVRVRILFNQNFRQSIKPSALTISPQKRIFLTDYGNLEIKLTPLEKTLYLFYLNHMEGVALYDLVDHRTELRAIYSSISNRGLLADIHNRIEDLVNANSNSASEKISKIKTAFVKAAGKKLSEHYFIRGLNGETKSISLDRELVFWKEQLNYFN